MTKPTKGISFEESGAFIEVFTVEPTGSGVLDGSPFAVKDLIDIKGHKTGCGNPTWRDTHPPATVHAICVEQLLAAGGRCVGKTITDELAFSLLGENYHYGTPLNPRAPECVPGGSSSGSASAVACGLADLALGTDTGGSVRVPASNCGVWGFRPSHGFIAVAGVNPLAPSFDTVGLFASNAKLLVSAASVLLSAASSSESEPAKVHLIREAFDLCDPEVRSALEPPLQLVHRLFGKRINETSMREIDEEKELIDLRNWYEIYRTLQAAEAESCLGSWVATAKPIFGPLITQAFEMTRTLDRMSIVPTMKTREKYFQRMNTFLGKNDLLCIPTVPAPAPLKGSIQRRERSGTGYYPRTLSLTSIAGVARLPQVSMPLADVSGAPIGLSLLASHGSDTFLLSVVESIAKSLHLLTAGNAEKK